MWVSCRSDLYAPGVEQAGLAADQVHVEPRDDKMLLAVIEDAVRDGTPCAIIAEARKVPMVASRRCSSYRREVNADRALKPPAEMVRRFAAYPDALRASVDIAAECTFDLGESLPTSTRTSA
ncbi:protein ImuA (plasmid) [Sphingobium cloacae]|uniref:Protein ImuA n=1 Tax=Sphingobium cloacae TaxID=120107 RepID=A0A1E1F8X1_9SPHN|nr:protein ImuA [Sphingobium cloacae]